MEKSFSLQFNPLTNVKSVKEYEEEIEKLKMENFELKTQLAHISNVPKILYENKQHVEMLEDQNKTLEINLNRMIEVLQQDKNLLENKYNQDMSMANERYSLLEDENKRLILRIEKLNKEFQHYSGTDKHIQNLNKSNYQQMEEINKLRSDILEQQSIISNLNLELNRRTEEIQREGMKNKNSALVINDLKNTLNSHIRGSEEEKTSLLLKLQKVEEQEKIINQGLIKFRKIILESLNDVSSAIMDINAKIFKIKKNIYVSEENKLFLRKMSADNKGLDDCISILRTKIKGIKSEFDEVKNLNKKFNSETIDELKGQFSEAKKELIICRNYLEKKAIENKNLKNMNARLEHELKKSIGGGKQAYLRI